jgi:hypothetical protein
MGLDIGESVNRAANWLATSPVLKTLLGSALLAALLLTLVALIVVTAVYKVPLRGRQGIRAGLYLYIASAALLYAHYYAQRRRFEADADADLFAKTHAAVTAASEINEMRGGTYRVDPNATQGYFLGSDDNTAAAAPAAAAAAAAAPATMGGAAPATMGGAAPQSWEAAGSLGLEPL